MPQAVSGRARWRAELAIAGLTCLLIAGAAVVPVSANAAAGCRVTYEVPSQWQNGFQANVGISNLGDPINGWRLTWTFPSGQGVTQVWDATTTSSGAQVTATNVSFNAAIPTNGSVSFGFLGSWAGGNTSPTSFSLFNSVRIPVTWSDHQGSAPNYTIDPTYVSRVRQVVDWALADGLYVLLNVHHDSWQWISSMPTNHDNVLVRYKATWTQIATAFRDEPTKLTFECVNEPQFTNAADAQAAPLLDELNRAFHSTVRTSGANNAARQLVLPPLGSSPDQARMDSLAGTLTALNDPNLVATVHYYGFWPFSVNIAGKTTFDADTKNDMVVDFDRMYNTFVNKGIPVILGEYGLLSYDYTRPGVIEAGEVKKFFEELGYQARTKKVTTMLWDAGSFLNRNTLQWRDADLLAQIKSSWTTRSATASSDMVFLPKSGAITTRTLTLNLNGTTFQGLRQGNADLSPGADYTISGDQLTLTASALTRLAGNRGYGVNATVQARFSQGSHGRST